MAILAILGSALASVSLPARAELGAITSCIESNAPRLSSVQKLVVESRDALDRLSESRAKLYWRRHSDGHQRLLVKMEAPDDLAGVALLVIGRSAERPSVYLYLPELDETRRVYSSEDVRPVMGGDVPVEEMQRLVNLADHATLRLLEERELGEHRVWVVEARPNAVSSYQRIVALVDQRYCLPLQLEFYGVEDRLMRRMRVDPDQVIRVAESWMPRRLEVEDFREGFRLMVKVVSLEVDIPLAPSLFTVKALKQ
jgi:outer membrane lipoprotein-sorting protein